MLAIQWKILVRVPKQLHEPLPSIERQYANISDFSEELIPQLFRFDNKKQLRDLKRAFRFTSRFEMSSGHVFSGEEVLLSGLFRLHAPNVQGDAGWRSIFGFDQFRR